MSGTGLARAPVLTSAVLLPGVGVEIILDPATNSLTVLGTIPGPAVSPCTRANQTPVLTQRTLRVPGSPAEKSGIKKGDVIVGVASPLGSYAGAPRCPVLTLAMLLPGG
eukprot:3454526-Rhodomonas_salina.3